MDGVPFIQVQSTPETKSGRFQKVMQAHLHPHELKETTLNDKNNTKVIAKLHQGHFKVKIAKKSTFYQIQYG